MRACMGLAELAAFPGGARAVGLERHQTWDLLVARSGAWSRAFEGADGAVGLHVPDSFECAAAILAAWAAGLTVVLPGDDTPHTLRAVRLHARQLFLGEAAVPSGLGTAGQTSTVPMPAVPLIVFTSGTTGEAVAVEKSAACVENELRSLEACFGERLRNSVILSTVTHQHYYGLLFRLLWPLSSGRPFGARRLASPEEIGACAAGLEACALVSSPALLKRIGETPASMDALAPLREAVREVFSSGGPLPWAAALRAKEALGTEPIEVYGSSETGGVAWRQRRQEDDPYIPFEGVETAIDDQGHLKLRSPHLSTRAWTRTDDLVEARGRGFQLLGRADRVVKIEETRVSLRALEQCLGAHPRVIEARVLVLDGPREVLGAVLRLQGTPPGGAAERRTVVGDLRRHLAEVAEAVALPRRWRFVDVWPVDSMGKSTVACLRALFKGDAVEPVRLGLRTDVSTAELELLLTDDLRWFKGHFPGLPLLPGVVQLHWAVGAARELLGLQGPFQGLRGMKFTRPLRPGQKVTLSVAVAAGGFEFRYTSGEGKHAAGRVLLG